MALDIYVMPLWRFKAGDFSSPIEAAIGIAPRVVTPDGVEDAAPRVGWLGRWRARREVEAARKAVEAANKVPVRWRDEGDVALGEQSGGMEPLRAYAVWLDHRDLLPEFESPPDGDYTRHPALGLDIDRPFTCPHLVGHDCFSGYFLPCDFERLVQVEPHLIMGHWPASKTVGSGVRLRRELATIAAQLRPDAEDGPPDGPLRRVRFAFRQLHKAVEVSMLRGLPIIFWG